MNPLPARSKTVVSLCCVAAVLAAAAARPGFAGDPGPESDPGFPVGEVLLCRLKWGVLPVGTARIASEWTADSPPLLRLSVQVRSNAFLDRFYRIEDMVISTVDPGTLLPVRFEKIMNEGGVSRRDVTEFDRARGLVFWRNLLKPEERTYAAPREVRDILSLMFALRSVPFAENETREFTVAGDDGPTSVHISIRERRTYKHDRYGPIPALHIRPKVGPDGLFLGRVPTDLWISAAAPCVLLSLSVDAPIGSIHLLLDAIEGAARFPTPG